jgi:hypothetical protein
MGLFAVGLLCLQVLFRLEEYEMKIPKLHGTHCDGVIRFNISFSLLHICFVCAFTPTLVHRH